jgi:hypothetical protein
MPQIEETRKVAPVIMPPVMLNVGLDRSSHSLHGYSPKAPSTPQPRIEGRLAPKEPPGA